MTSAYCLRNFVVIIICIVKFESHVQIANLCTPLKISNVVESFVLQELQFQQIVICRKLLGTLLLQVKVRVTMRLTVSQSVSLGVEPHLRLITRYLLHVDSYGLVFMGRSL
jgi:hypothetical protein